MYKCIDKGEDYSQLYTVIKLLTAKLLNNWINLCHVFADMRTTSPSVFVSFLVPIVPPSGKEKN